MRTRKCKDLLGQEMVILNNQSSGRKGDEGIELSHHCHMETAFRELQQRAEETNWLQLLREGPCRP